MWWIKSTIMKNYVILIALFAYCIMSAQDFRGTATYEVKLNVDAPKADNSGKELPPDIQAALAAQLMKASLKTYTLDFDKSASLYRQEERLDVPQPQSQVQVQINSIGEGKLYRNLKEKMLLQETELFGKEFLITDSLKKPEWQLGAETKKIGDYLCHKATMTIKPPKRRDEPKQQNSPGIMIMEPKEMVITAWYTTEIPVAHGPADYWGLPGLILEASDGHRTILCSKVILNPANAKEIVKPSKGKKIHREEFQKLAIDKAIEMQQMNNRENGGNGGMRIIRAGG